MKRLITAVNPVLIVPSDPMELLDAIGKKPLNVRYEFVVNLGLDEIIALLKWLATPGLIAAEGERVQEGGTDIPARLMAEFSQIVEQMMKDAKC